MKEAVAIRVRDWVGDLGALKPAEGESLARHLIGRSGSAKITLNFAGIEPLHLVSRTRSSSSWQARAPLRSGATNSSSSAWAPAKAEC